MRFLRTKSRAWVDSGLEHAWEDPYTIQAVGDLTIRLHAAQALLEKAGFSIDAAVTNPTAETVAYAQIVTAEAKVLSTEIAIAATNKLFELAGTRSTLAEHNLDRHWRNARTHTLHDPVRWKYAIVGNYALNRIQSTAARVELKSTERISSVWDRFQPLSHDSDVEAAVGNGTLSEILTRSAAICILANNGVFKTLRLVHPHGRRLTLLPSPSATHPTPPGPRSSGAPARFPRRRSCGYWPAGSCRTGSSAAERPPGHP